VECTAGQVRKLIQVTGKPGTTMWNYNFYVHITTNPAKTVLYIGVTNDLNRRLYEHAENKGSNKTFAGKSTAII